MLVLFIRRRIVQSYRRLLHNLPLFVNLRFKHLFYIWKEFEFVSSNGNAVVGEHNVLGGANGNRIHGAGNGIFNSHGNSVTGRGNLIVN